MRNRHGDEGTKMEQITRPKECFGCNFVIYIFHVFLGWNHGIRLFNFSLFIIIPMLRHEWFNNNFKITILRN